MSDLFSNFSPASLSEWEAVLLKELKGEPIEKLHKINKIEEIAFPAYVHKDAVQTAFSDPGAPPFTRGNQCDSNDWHVATPFRISDVKKNNTEILHALMHGTTALVLEAENGDPIDFRVLLNEVGLEYIHTTLHAQSLDQVRAFLDYAQGAPTAVLFADNRSLIPLVTSAANCRLFTIQGNLVQAAGGSTWQELSIALAEGHDLLVDMLDQGISIDQAASCIRFQFGLGNKFFFEVAKFRAFRSAWARIVSAYEPEHAHAGAASITAVSGFLHTSLKDPYTNLLRQTTEALSAVVGGIDSLVLYPYDWYAAQSNTPFTRRMATNISLLLKEESYLDKVIDPAGGSYAIELLTQEIAERTWAEFQRIEREGGITNADLRAVLSQEISAKATLRQQAVADKSEKLIGINVFPNPETVDHTWKELPAAWNHLPTLVLENTL